MKRIYLVLLLVVLLLAFTACGGTGTGTGNSGDNSGSGNGGTVGTDSGAGGFNPNDYYPDDSLPTDVNTFSFEKVNASGNAVTVKLKLGGSTVKLAGFELYVKFPAGVSVTSVVGAGSFAAMTHNKGTAGQVKLLWAGAQNVTAASDVCTIVFDMSSVDSASLTVEFVSLGYIDTATLPPVKNIRASCAEFTLTK